MPFNIEREDHKAVMSEDDIRNLTTNENKLLLVEKILNSLNEKRDAYNGIIISMIYILRTEDPLMIQSLESGLIKAIIHKPMKYSGKMFISKVHTRLMKEMPLFVEDLFEKIILEAPQWSQDFNTDDLSIQIIALKAIRMAEQHPKGRPTLISQHVIEQLCEDAINGSSDETKVDTISLVLECRVTTKPLEQRELVLFKAVYRDALSFSEPSLRQVLLSGTNKLIKRIKDSYKAVIRYTKIYSEEQKVQVRIRYMNFLQWIIEFSFDSIYCNAYHGSFIITINTLKYVLKHITYTDPDLPILEFLNKKHCYESLLTCINDSFEQNKTLSLELILMLPHNDKFINDRNLKSFENIAYQLVDSINPAHSLSCIYMFKLLIGLSLRMDGVKLTKNQQLLYHLTLLIDQVATSILETRKNFVSALNHKPIYSKLSCIRALLNDVDITLIEEDRTGWEKLTKKIVTCSIDACGAVSTVVCNLNPETIGHLPMDLKPLDTNALAENLKVNVVLSEENINTISSQMLLIAGWKTIKECSLSLGLICERFWWPPKKKVECSKTLQSQSILNYDLIVNIIDFFEHYLRNLRHRGAFEQAYYGFTMVTRQLWQDERYKNLLIQILEKIMDDFTTETLDEKKTECLKAYVTRRSAGLPFIIQAILNSEHKHESKTLRWVMDNLFRLLDNKTTEEYKRIHCLNILRALIKEHCLGEKVESYIGKTFIVTLDAFGSDSFSIRNCASMLLKAVVDRTFGVNRLKEDIHRHNQLPFVRFFEHCPSLHQIMLKLLVNSDYDGKSLATIHAIFIVLFRLRPCVITGLKEANEELIQPFLVPIKDLAINCKDYKLRDLAAKLYTRLESFISTSSRSSHLALESIRVIMFPEKKVNDVQISKSDMNRLHGYLLLTKYQLECYELDGMSHLDSIELLVKEILSRKEFSSCIKLAALDLVETYCINNFEQGNIIAYQLLQPIIDWFEFDQTTEPMFENLLFRATTTFLMSMMKSNLGPSSNLNFAIDRDLVYLLGLLQKTIIEEPNFIFSVNLQASMIRFIRQVTEAEETFVDRLMNNLDLDYAAALLTPFDRLNKKLENDNERDKLSKYCTLTSLPLQMKNFFTQSFSETKALFKLSNYQEFNLEEGSNLSLKNRNTPRAIELMAYVCKNFSNYKKNWISFRDLIQFMNRLPECDLKCLMLLHGGQLLDYEFNKLSHSYPNNERSGSEEVKQLEPVNLQNVEEFCSVLDELSNDGHCTNTRETCIEVLGIIFLKSIPEIDIPKKCLKNLLSALIKLSQDEERGIRQSSLTVMLSLEKQLNKFNPSDIEESFTIVSPLGNLIKLITCKWLNARVVDDCNDCFELMTRIIFNHSKNYSNDLNGEKEHLFDRTKLNNFSDHVSTIQSSLEGLRMFFSKRLDDSGQLNLISIDSLKIPNYVKQELRVVNFATNNDTGDYSWRLKKIKEQTENQFSIEEHATDNNELVDEAIECILVSMEYFSNKYWNMLIDTDYTYHELSFFKRIVFLKFILECTDHNLKKQHLVSSIRESLTDLTEESCCTTLLKKCLNLML